MYSCNQSTFTKQVNILQHGPIAHPGQVNELPHGAWLVQPGQQLVIAPDTMTIVVAGIMSLCLFVIGATCGTPQKPGIFKLYKALSTAVLILAKHCHTFPL